MNKHKIIKQGKKLLFSSMAAAVLGVICVTTKPVKAATVNGDYTSTNSVNTKKAELNYQAKNNAPTVKNDNAKFDSAKAAKSDTVKTGEWMGIKVSFNTDTHTLSIGGGTITNYPVNIGGMVTDLHLLRVDWDDLTYVFDANDVQTVNFTDHLTIKGSASQWFAQYRNLKTINGFENVDLTQVTDMSSMFMYCESLENLDLNKIFQPGKTYSVTDTSHMFDGCASLTNLDLSNLDTSNVTDMSYMFNGCSKLTQLDVSNFNTANVNNMESMFSFDSQVTAIKGLDKFDTSKVQNMARMFFNCINLKELDLSHFNTSNVRLFAWMFKSCKNLNTLNISNFDMSNAMLKMNMFTGLSNLQTLVLGKKCMMANTGLDTPGTWMNMGDKSQKARFKKGKFNWTSQELMSNYNGNINYDAYTIVK